MRDPLVGKRHAGADVSLAVRHKILVIEDDMDQRNALGQRLRFEGYETLFAADVPGAVRLARIHKPHFIILDLGLPGGDGYLVMDRINALPETGPIPFLVLSARDAAQEKPRAMERGAIAYFQKPVPNAALRAVLAAHLRG